MPKRKGLHQSLEYSSSADRLYFTITVDGEEKQPDSAPEITIYDPSGDAIVTTTDMTSAAITTDAYLAYVSQTAEFDLGSTLTGGTSSATAIIKSDRKSGTSGILELGNIDGTFSSGETITDANSGSATTSGTLYTCTYYHTINLSDTDTWEIAQNYYAEIEFDVDSVSYKRLLYFDVNLYPMIHPIVSSQDVDTIHPDWIRSRPSSWPDWQNIIEFAHAELVRRIHAHGEQAAHFVKREEEFFSIELAFVEAQIGISLRFEDEERNFYIKKREETWTGRGQFTFNKDETAEIEEEPKLLTIRLVR